MRLFINNIFIPTEKESIYQTKQVNTFFRLDNRQSNLTNTFKLPKTPETQKAFALLGVTGNTSRVPYQLNEASLYSDIGEAFIYKGRAVVTVTSQTYSVTIYDGNVDIYAAMENLKLSDIDLPLLSHSKTILNVKNSLINTSSKYRYMIADFGGRTKTFNGFINIDYLCPFANVKYIWDQIFAKLGFTYECSAFNTQEWLDLWLSYPKGTVKAGDNPVVFNGTDPNGATSNFFLDFSNIISNTTITRAGSVSQSAGLVVNEAGTYTIKLVGSIGGGQIARAGSVINLCKNTSSTAPNSIPALELFAVNTGGANINVSKKINLNAGDIIHFAFLAGYDGVPSKIDDGIELTITKNNAAVVDFSDGFKDMTVRDFFSEILFKFGLTPIKDKYSNHYKFLTLDEITDVNNALDWSRKFEGVTEETYVYENYSQNNYFKYKYHNEGDVFFNSNLPIDNKNISVETTVIQSKMFAPSQMELGGLVWKMYDREVKDDGTVDYKNLTGRFFFATSVRQNLFPSKRLSSEYETGRQSINFIYNPIFKFQDWNYITSKYYGSIYRVLQDSKMIKARFNLKDKDIINIDLGRAIYVEQLSNYFVITKIDKYADKGGSTGVEMIRVIPFNPNTDKLPPALIFDDGLTIKECLPFNGKVKIALEGIKPTDIVSFQPMEAQVATQLNLNNYEVDISGETRIRFSVNGVNLNDLKINYS